MLYGHTVASSWPIAALQPIADMPASHRITICSDPAVLSAAEEELLAMPRSTLKRGEVCAGGETAVGPAGWFDGVGTFVLDCDGRRIAASPPRDAVAATWERLVVGWAVPILLSRLGATVLHACAVASQDRAWIICAPSGTGKTTTSLALRDAGMHLLSDDVAVLDADTELVAAGPRGSHVLDVDGTKTMRFHDAAPPPAPLPLAGLGLLRPRGTGELHRRMAPVEAFTALLPHACPGSEDARGRMTRRIAELARSLPVLAISMPDDLTALPAAAAELAAILS